MNATFTMPFRLWIVAALLCLAGSDLGAVVVTIEQSSSAPLMVGAPVKWTASTDVTDSPIEYQFSVSLPGGYWWIVRDFSNRSGDFEWTPMKDGTHSVRVVARQSNNGELSTAEASFQVLSRVGADQKPVITATANPLVFLFSAPPCSARSMSVEFVRTASFEDPTMTNAKTCDPDSSTNLWIAGLAADTGYSARYRLWNENGEPVYEGAPVVFTTGTVTVKPPATRVLTADQRLMDVRYGLLLQSQMNALGRGMGTLPIAHKLDGTLMWYYDATVHGPLSNLLRPIQNGQLLVVPGGSSPGGLRAIDLAGNTVWETNAEAMSVRLEALGLPPIGAFHHDAHVLPDGTILALANSRRSIPGATPQDPVRDVVGDVILHFDRSFNLLWVWDTFEKLDLNRKAVLGEKAVGGAEDWTHGNAIFYTPEGNIIYSTRHQDWLVKIDFQNGAGSGDIIWRMGPQGDFSIDSNDPYPWFSHQHDPHYDGVRLWVFDNGNTRYQALGNTGNSRGQVYVLNEDARTATLEVNQDLGVYSPALGSAQRMASGNLHFLSGNLLDLDTGKYASQSAEVSGDLLNGPLRYVFEAASAAYRSFRLMSLYQPE